MKPISSVRERAPERCAGAYTGMTGAGLRSMAAVLVRFGFPANGAGAHGAALACHRVAERPRRREPSRQCCPEPATRIGSADACHPIFPRKQGEDAAIRRGSHHVIVRMLLLVEKVRREEHDRAFAGVLPPVLDAELLDRHLARLVLDRNRDRPRAPINAIGSIIGVGVANAMSRPERHGRRRLEQGDRDRLRAAAVAAVRLRVAPPSCC